MATVLFLGGYGQFGLPTAELLAGDPQVDQIVIAGRNLEKAQGAAAQIGHGAEARTIDADDPVSLSSGLRGSDVVVSALWPAEGRAVRVARAAVEAGAHYVDLLSSSLPTDLEAAANSRELALLTSVGMSPGVVDSVSNHLVASVDQPSILVAVRHWTRLLDAWADLFDAYIDLPGGRKRGPQGQQLFEAMSATPRDPDRVATVVRDACLVPFWVTLAGDPDRWRDVPVLSDGRWTDVDATSDGLEIAVSPEGNRTEKLLAATGPNVNGGLQRISGWSTGMRPAFDDAVRDVARRVASGADVEAEVQALEERVTANIRAYLRPAEEIATLPTAQWILFGHKNGAPVRASLVLSDELFAADRFVYITAAAVAVTVRYLLDGTATTRGVATMTDVIADMDRFAKDYMALLPGISEGTPLFTMRLDSA